MNIHFFKKYIFLSFFIITISGLSHAASNYPTNYDSHCAHGVPFNELCSLCKNAHFYNPQTTNALSASYEEEEEEVFPNNPYNQQEFPIVYIPVPQQPVIFRVPVYIPQPPVRIPAPFPVYIPQFPVQGQQAPQQQITHSGKKGVSNSSGAKRNRRKREEMHTLKKQAAADKAEIERLKELTVDDNSPKAQDAAAPQQDAHNQSNPPRMSNEVKVALGTIIRATVTPQTESSNPAHDKDPEEEIKALQPERFQVEKPKEEEEELKTIESDLILKLKPIEFTFQKEQLNTATKDVSKKDKKYLRDFLNKATKQQEVEKSRKEQARFEAEKLAKEELEKKAKKDAEKEAKEKLAELEKAQKKAENAKKKAFNAAQSKIPESVLLEAKRIEDAFKKTDVKVEKEETHKKDIVEYSTNTKNTPAEENFKIALSTYKKGKSKAEKPTDDDDFLEKALAQAALERAKVKTVETPKKEPANQLTGKNRLVLLKAESALSALEFEKAAEHFASLAEKTKSPSHYIALARALRKSINLSNFNQNDMFECFNTGANEALNVLKSQEGLFKDTDFHNEYLAELELCEMATGRFNPNKTALLVNSLRKKETCTDATKELALKLELALLNTGNHPDEKDRMCRNEYPHEEQCTHTMEGSLIENLKDADPDLQLRLAELYFCGLGIQQSKEKSFQLLKEIKGKNKDKSILVDSRITRLELEMKDTLDSTDFKNVVKLIKTLEKEDRASESDSNLKKMILLKKETIEMRRFLYYSVIKHPQKAMDIIVSIYNNETELGYFHSFITEQLKNDKICIELVTNLFEAFKNYKEIYTQSSDVLDFLFETYKKFKFTKKQKEDNGNQAEFPRFLRFMEKIDSDEEKKSLIAAVQKTTNLAP